MKNTVLATIDFLGETIKSGNSSPREIELAIAGLDAINDYRKKIKNALDALEPNAERHTSREFAAILALIGGTNDLIRYMSKEQP